MAVNVRRLRCTPEDVFRVFADGWTFPSWVVGASRMRDVDAQWPQPGTHIHHSFGVWPAIIDDETIVEELDVPRRIVMRAKGWPLGVARIIMDVRPSGQGCLVRMEEHAIAGPGRFVPRPIMDLLLYWRNAETLHRLAYLAEGIAPGPKPPSTAEREMSDGGV